MDVHYRANISPCNPSFKVLSVFKSKWLFIRQNILNLYHSCSKLAVGLFSNFGYTIFMFIRVVSK